MTKPTFTKEDVIGIEPKHVSYARAHDGSPHDILAVKEVIHLKDGRRIPRLRLVEDYKRPFWITHKGRRTHTEKKDYEYVSNLQAYSSTQVELAKNIVNILKDYSSGPNPPIRRLARSPYLYGVDISSTALIKNDYRQRWPDLISPNRVAGGDIETNVHSRNGEIICMSVTHKENVSIFYLAEWVSDIDDPIGRTRAMAEEHIGDTLKARNITEIEVVICKTPAEIVVEATKRLHQWKPEFWSFWNIDFDLTHMIRMLEQENIDPADVFNSPEIPSQYRYFDPNGRGDLGYRRGPTQKVTASGRSISIAIEDRWNWVSHLAEFQMIDAMPVYRNLRLAAGKDSSYALDYILEKELGITKLKFDVVQHLSGLRWHEEMQKHHKIEYGVYNIFDSISLELLDEKTNDLALNISLFSKNSDYRNFNSNPKRLIDDLHFWYLRQSNPCVIGSSSDEMASELDKHVIDHSDWIVTLPSYMVGPGGLECVKEFPGYKTIIFGHVVDLDIVATYPRVSQLLNISRETCTMEFSKIQGITEHHRREVGVNLMAGPVNAVEICEKILGAPELDTLLERFEEQHGKKDHSSGLGGTPTGMKSAPEEIVDTQRSELI